MTEKTSRGFDLHRFVDHYGQPCTLQCSSAIDFDVVGGLENPGSSYLWLGRDELLPDGTLSHAHLSREQVRMLVRLMTRWLKTGGLQEGGDDV